MQQRNLHSAAVVLAVASATCLGAGWSGVWPSEEHPRETYRQLSECYSGIVERCVATDALSPPANTWWRSNRYNLLQLKIAFKSMVTAVSGQTQWMNTNTTPACPSAAWLNAQLPTATDFPSLFATSLCIIAKVPTNYFEYTPYRCLTGLGPYTNDTAVTYPHGYTNASTAAGGTNFPPGRTQWYTTDYGWNQMPTLLAHLTITRKAGVLWATNKFVGYTPGFGWSNTWAAAKQSAENDYKAYAGDGVWNWYGAAGGCGRFGDPSLRRGELQMSRFFCTAAAFVTNSPSFGEYFVYSKPYPVDGATTNSIYDAVGSGMVETQYVMIANDQTNALGGYGVTAAFGNTNLPTWCTEPIPPPVIINATYHLRGMVVDTTTYIIRTYRKWIIPGGFRFY